MSGHINVLKNNKTETKIPSACGNRAALYNLVNIPLNFIYGSVLHKITRNILVNLYFVTMVYSFFLPLSIRNWKILFFYTKVNALTR